MAVTSYRDLQVWQKATDLVVESYRLTVLLPKSELYGLAVRFRERLFLFRPILPKVTAGSIWEIISIIFLLRMGP